MKCYLTIEGKNDIYVIIGIIFDDIMLSRRSQTRLFFFFEISIPFINITKNERTLRCKLKKICTGFVC